MSIEPTARTLRRAKRAAEPDLVDRMLEMLVREVPALKPRAEEIAQALRGEFAGEDVYIRRRAGPPAALVVEVLRRFNGRNVTEVARELRISRATVYRMLRQGGGATQAAPAHEPIA